MAPQQSHAWQLVNITTSMHVAPRSPTPHPFRRFPRMTGAREDGISTRAQEDGILCRPEPRKRHVVLLTPRLVLQTGRCERVPFWLARSREMAVTAALCNAGGKRSPLTALASQLAGHASCARWTCGVSVTIRLWLAQCFIACEPETQNKRRERKPNAPTGRAGRWSK